MKTKVAISFLSSAVQKVEDKKEVPEDLFFETNLVQKEGDLPFWQSVQRIFGYQPQGWKVDPNIISQHKSDIQALVEKICPSGVSLYRAQYSWENEGYDSELFDTFLVVALYSQTVTAYWSRIGVRLVMR